MSKQSLHPVRVLYSELLRLEAAKRRALKRWDQKLLRHQSRLVSALAKICPENGDIAATIDALYLKVSSGAAPGMYRNQACDLNAAVKKARNTINKASLERLITCLQKPKNRVRWSTTLRLIGDFGQKADVAVPVIRSWLHPLIASNIPSDNYAITSLIMTLGEIGTRKAVTTLRWVLTESENEDHQAEAVQTLGWIGPRAKAALPAIRAWLSGKTEDSFMADYGEKAIVRIAGEN